MLVILNTAQPLYTGELFWKALSRPIYEYSNSAIVDPED